MRKVILPAIVFAAMALGSSANSAPKPTSRGASLFVITAFCFSFGGAVKVGGRLGGNPGAGATFDEICYDAFIY